MIYCCTMTPMGYKQRRQPCRTINCRKPNCHHKMHKSHVKTTMLMGHRGPFGSCSSAGMRYSYLFQSRQGGDARPWIPPPPPVALPISFPGRLHWLPMSFAPWCPEHQLPNPDNETLLKGYRGSSGLKVPKAPQTLWTAWPRSFGLFYWCGPNSGTGTFLKMFAFTPGIRWDKTDSERSPSEITAAPDLLCLPGLRLCDSSCPSKPQLSWASKPQETQEQFWAAQPVALQGWLGFNYAPGGFLVGGWSNSVWHHLAMEG